MEQNSLQHTDSVVADNLRLAADAMLPVPTTVITTASLPGPAIADFTAETHVEPVLEAIRRQQEEGGSWVFSSRDDDVLLTIEGRRTSGEAKAPVATYLQYTFPRGDLEPDADLASTVAQLRSSLAALQVGAARIEVSVPRPGPRQFAFWFGALDLKPLARDYAAAPDNYRDGWSLRQVRAWSTSRLISVPVNVLNLGDGALIGFSAKSFVTESIKTGVTVATWYEIPGLSVVSPPTTSE